MSVNGTQVEDKMRRFKGECAQFSFNRYPIYILDGASVKFNTNSQETDNRVFWEKPKKIARIAGKKVKLWLSQFSYERSEQEEDWK